MKTYTSFVSYMSQHLGDDSAAGELAELIKNDGVLQNLRESMDDWTRIESHCRKNGYSEDMLDVLGFMYGAYERAQKAA